MALNELLIPKHLAWDEKSLTLDYGKIVLEPLERGYGVTVGNSLRRVLLSSIPGDAVTSIKIDGVLHENAVIPGVAEDVLDIIMNLKSLVVRMVTGDVQTLYLDVEREGIVTAKDFQPNSAVEVLSPDLHIATLSPGAALKMEVNVSRGRGYIPAEGNKKSHQPIGLIPVDSIYSPVRRVKYNVENTRVGQITDYEKLTMEIWTNGSVTPQDSLTTASQILVNHLEVFMGISKTEEAVEPVPGQPSGAVAYNEQLDRSVEELELSVRAYNCLKSANIKTIRELISQNEDDMLKFRNFGRKSLNEIKEVLNRMGLSLGMGSSGSAAAAQEDYEEEEEKPSKKRKSRSS